jgi:two-component system response regulator AtoC
MTASGASSSPRAGKGRILIVDDEEGMRDLLKAILEADYQVTEADSGAALRKALDREQPDVVLLDIKLPDTNGLGLLRAIKQRWPATEVIILSGAPTGSGAASWAAEAIKGGAFGFLSKSAEFSFRKVLTCVSSALERRWQAQGNSTLPLGA